MSAPLDDRLPVAAGSAGPDVTRGVEFVAVFPAAPEAVQVVRGYVRVVAGEWGVRVGEVELIASELASCAVRETLGGVFTMTARRGPGWVRVEVGMRGGGWWPAGAGEDALAYGYGLALVAGLADRFGHQGTSEGAAVLWAEVAASGAGGGW